MCVTTQQCSKDIQHRRLTVAAGAIQQEDCLFGDIAGQRVSQCLLDVAHILFVTACDLAARLLFSPYELPVGLLLAVVGGPFFFWLLLRRKEGAE